MVELGVGLMKISMEQWHSWTFPAGSEWTEWRSFDDVKIEAPRSAGVYVVGMKCHDGISRLLGIDPHGVLDIGESNSLRDRLESFRRCAASSGQTGHMAGWRLGTGGLLTRLGMTIDNLRVSWRLVAPDGDSYHAEGVLLHAYFGLFGELPPLNYKFNWSAFVSDA